MQANISAVGALQNRRVD